MRIDNLRNNTAYTLTAGIFDNKFEYRQLMYTESFMTLENESYVPDVISNTTFHVDYDSIGNSFNLLTFINWEPAEGEYSLAKGLKLE